MPRKSRIDARLPTPEAALSLCAGTRLPSPSTAVRSNASISGNGGQVSGNGGQAPGAIHHIIARALKEGKYSGISTAVTAS